MVTPEAVLDAQLRTAHNVLRMLFTDFVDVSDPWVREELEIVLGGDALDIFDDLKHESLTDAQRTLLASSIEELVTIRSLLPVETGSA
ncbi:hypothetical protein [Candidatus Poriferisodalis sp.]|uniref:hypothetical protein n=1 Tax=Candidatus Poriferisodalis sp. TaxID=3101277 RepID=UPI003B020B7E